MSERKFTGSSAWEQMVGQQMSLLAQFDEAKRQAKGHEVQTFHGRVAEAAFRDWLANFLPKRFGVTSGYVVSQGQSGEVQYPHFDVIIYDQLNAPILWVESSADHSEKGKSRALPVEYVHGVLEVKATYNSTTAKEAMEHLRDLAPFYAGFDPPQERYKKYLPPAFFCAVVFFEALGNDLKSEAAKEHLKPTNGPRGFFGGTILRAERQESGTSGTIQFAVERTSEGRIYHWLGLWSNMCFSRFAFDVVALLNGTYHPSFISSFNAFPIIGSEDWGHKET